MSPVTEVAVFLVAFVMLAFYLSWTAGRIDRMHGRVEAARAALDAQLVRRASVALQLAASSLLDPAASVIVAEAAREAQNAPETVREQTESDLSRALRAALDRPGQAVELRAAPTGAQLLVELEAASRRVVMARRFHNDAVRATRAVRRKRHVRYLRLAGHAAMPPSFEFDDSPPDCLAREL